MESKYYFGGNGTQRYAEFKKEFHRAPSRISLANPLAGGQVPRISQKNGVANRGDAVIDASNEFIRGIFEIRERNLVCPNYFLNIMGSNYLILTFEFMKNSKSFSFKVIFFALLLSSMACTDLLAQKSNNQLAIGAELGPVITDRFHGYEFQVGLPVKVYYGIGNHSQLLLRTGIHHLWVPSESLYEPTISVTAYLVPLAVGYRRSLRNFYAEGSIGVAYEKSRAEFENPYSVSAQGDSYPLNYGIEVGYQLHRFDFGFSLQNNTINHHHGFIHTGMVGLKAMYKIDF
ncbi:hypothetical protein KI659_13275 [Litoribacter alkaliphilus]|uniref:Uncharacterized protein n=1 Tax=Litoribacter ruber TaxID=702568 RepID=A0AAP2CLU0_9BACT|nr:hypothetical protein [Litoribacter alkaliphilus]MBS9524985.1 hypothetical protein [Litoribacter alkaliphilus]